MNKSKIKSALMNGIFFLCLVVLPITATNNNPLVIVTPIGSGGISIVINSQTHQDYGVAYPVTYIFNYSEDIKDILVTKKYTTNSAWGKIESKTENDSFNGIEAVRIDKENKKIYLSVAFSSLSDTIYTKLLDINGRAINIKFDGIAKYYDNRKAAVTASADDWHLWFHKAFMQTVDRFRKHNLYITCGTVSEKHQFTVDVIKDIQTQLDKGYLELAAHSRNHLHTEYPDIEYEVTGSRDDILNNFRLPDSYRNGKKQYVYVWIAPYGEYTDNTHLVVRKNKYFFPRLYEPGLIEASKWNNEEQVFTPAGMTLEIGRPFWGGGISGIDTLNSEFDRALANNGVYHFMCHPEELVKDWDTMPYLEDHLAYVSNRKNIWYASLGHLYLYQLIYQTSNKN